MALTRGQRRQPNVSSTPAKVEAPASLSLRSNDLPDSLSQRRRPKPAKPTWYQPGEGSGTPPQKSSAV